MKVLESNQVTLPVSSIFTVRVYLNPNIGRFWTSDPDEGDQDDPKSLHLYTYCTGDPANRIDPSGYYSFDSMPDVSSSISGRLIAGANPTGFTGAGGTCGPDITIALQNTMLDVEQAFTNDPAHGKRAADNVFKADMFDGWDIDLLSQIGFPNGAPDFGNGSALGTGLGADTVQVSVGGLLKVYHGGSVNYILWGRMFHLIHKSVYKGPAFSETVAVAEARTAKSLHLDFNSAYAQEAEAFVRYGYSGKNPSNTALPLSSNAGNVASSAKLRWRWIGLRDRFQ